MSYEDGKGEGSNEGPATMSHAETGGRAVTGSRSAIGNAHLEANGI